MKNNKDLFTRPSKYTLLAIYVGFLFSCSHVSGKNMFGKISINEIHKENSAHDTVPPDSIAKLFEVIRQIVVYDSILQAFGNIFTWNQYKSNYRESSGRTKIKPYFILMYALGFLTSNVSAQCCKCFQNKTELQTAVDIYIPSPIPCPNATAPAPFVSVVDTYGCIAGWCTGSVDGYVFFV